MTVFDVLLLGIASAFGVYCFVAYRKNRTPEYRGYLIITAIGIVVYAFGVALSAIPGLSVSQREALREFFFYFFALGVLLWLIVGIVILYRKNWRKR